jgi:hypothetical protein
LTTKRFLIVGNVREWIALTVLGRKYRRNNKENKYMSKVRELLEKSNGKIFTVEFVKKDGSLRRMNCRLGVTKHLAGGELRYKAEDYNLMPVFDVQAKGYKMICLDTVKSIRLDGKEYIFL